MRNHIGNKKSPVIRRLYLYTIRTGGPTYTFVKPFTVDLFKDLITLQIYLADLGIYSRSGRLYLSDLDLWA
jgi:hypothetical protein